MRAEEKSLRFLSLEGKLVVPFFQRKYVWQDENWEDLLNEFCDERKSSNFLGAIVLKEVDTASDETRILEIIDGQQRLITLCILLKALYDTLPVDIKTRAEDSIMDILKIRKYGENPTWDLRIEPSHLDAEVYKKLFEEKFIPNDNDDNLILKCYNFFLKKFNEMPIDIKLNILDKLLQSDNKLFVVIYLDKHEDEQYVFDVLNTTGVRLSLADKVKCWLHNRYRELLQAKSEYKVEEKESDKSVKKAFESLEKIFAGDEESLYFWSRTKNIAGIGRDQRYILLYSIAVIERFYNPEKNRLDELDKLYKDYINQIKSLYELERFIRNIIDYASIYIFWFKAIDDQTPLFYEDYVLRLQHILKELRIYAFYPFLLYVCKKYKNNANKIKKIVSKLEKLIIRNAIVGQFPDYSKLCQEFIADISNLDKRLNELSWEKVARVLKGEEDKKISAAVAKLLLFWIELYRRSKYKDNLDTEKKLKYEYSLEHIMPINWQNTWNFDKVPHPRSNELSTEEQRKDRKKKINLIGNMTLLKSELNMSIKNFDFRRKMEGERDKPGVKDLGATLSITKDDIIIPYIMGDKVWDEAKIEARTEKLEKELREIWG